MSQDSYPSDILLLISNHLDSTSNKQLCLVSQYFHSIFAPIILQNIRILFCQENDSTSESIDERLQSCQHDLPNVCRYARSLRVNTKGYYVSRHVTRSLLPGLWQTVARMTILESLKLEWDRCANDEEMEEILEYQEHIVRSILEATGDNLTRLVLKPDPRSPSLPASLTRIRGLNFLRIVCDKRGYTCSTWFNPDDDEDLPCCCRRPWLKDVIKPLIAANPALETLEIKQGCKYQGSDPNDILPASLTNLTYLTISGLDIPSIRDDGTPLVHISPLKSLRHLAVRAPYGKLKIDAFWDALRAAKPPLETLVSFQISHSMFSHLSSFSGLRSLELLHIKEPEDCYTPTPTLVSVFLTDVLPRHAESLERLVIDYDAGVNTIPGWDFDSSTWSPALSHLSRLQYLSIFPPIPTDTDTDISDSSEMSAPQLVKAYQTILDDVMDLPELRTLKIDFPTPSGGCGTGYMRWNSGVCKTLSEVVPELRVRGARGKPEVLELHNGTQYCVRLHGGDEIGDSEVWGYSPTKAVEEGIAQS